VLYRCMLNSTICFSFFSVFLFVCVCVCLCFMFVLFCLSILFCVLWAKLPEIKLMMMMINSMNKQKKHQLVHSVQYRHIVFSQTDNFSKYLHFLLLTKTDDKRQLIIELTT